VDRVELTDEKLRRRLQDGVRKFARQGTVKSSEWAEFARHIHYQQGDFKKLQTYTALGAQCAKLEKEWDAMLADELAIESVKAEARREGEAILEFLRKNSRRTRDNAGRCVRAVAVAIKGFHARLAKAAGAEGRPA
jgi:glucose-6-phosphate 1-dehydrogenase